MILKEALQMGKFVIRKTNTGIKFDLKAGNGEAKMVRRPISSKSSSTRKIVLLLVRNSQTSMNK